MSIFVFIYLMVLVIAIGTAVVLWATEKPENSKKLLRGLLLTVATVMISILFGCILYGAAAENAVDDCAAEITVVEIPVAECEIFPTIYGTAPASIVEFNYNGMKLSFYWTGTIKCWKTFVIKVNNNSECVHARYKEFTVDDFIDGCNRN